MIRWKDSPDRSTPITAANLNGMVDQIEENMTKIATNTSNISTNTSSIASAISRILGLETKVNKTVGSSAKPIWLNNGEFTASNSNIGSATQPVYMSGGQLYAGTSYANATVNKAASADYATSAGSATSATNATNATNATKATKADTAEMAKSLSVNSVKRIMYSISCPTLSAGEEKEIDTDLRTSSDIGVPVSVAGFGLSNGYSFTSIALTDPDTVGYKVRVRIKNNTGSSGSPAMKFVDVLYIKM